MAKAKSSQQEDLATSKTGIDMTFGLGFSPKKEQPKTEAPKTEESSVSEVKNETVDKKVEETKVEPSVNQTVTTKSESSTAAKTKESSKSKPVAKKQKSASTKLQRPENPDKDETIYKISALISGQAKENLEKYAKLYGYKKISPFINDLFEHLDAYMDDEE